MIFGRLLGIMKVAVLVLCGLAIVAAQGNDNTQQADRKFLQKQKELLLLFINLQQPSFDPKQQQQAKNFTFQNQLKNSNNPTAVEQFISSYKLGLVQRGEVFNFLNTPDNREAIQLFDLFYFAKDYDTFFQAACWARNNVNEGLFAYALSVAILNRPDTQGIFLPPQSEVFPYLYVNTRAVQQAQLLKQQGLKEGNVRSNVTDNYFYTYYPEDINLNQQFAYEQLKYPAWFGGEKYQQSEKQSYINGEYFFYYLQQLQARYDLEKRSNQLPGAQPLDFNKNIYPGYNPQLQYFNGQPLPARPEHYNVYYNAEYNRLQHFLNIDRRIADVVDGNRAFAADGSNVQLNENNGIKILGDIIQNNQYSVNRRFYSANNGRYSYLDQCRRVVGSVIDPQNIYGIAPSAVENDNTANRDPAFYQCLTRTVMFLKSFKNQFKPYTKEQLGFQGVKVQNVKVDKLITYVDNAEVDLFNAINYNQGEKPEEFKFRAQQQQLNYKPFTYRIQVNSDKDTNAIVRVFIGSKFTSGGDPKDLEGIRQSFVEIDRFLTSLKSGQNQIQRNSQESTIFAQQQPSTRELYRQLHSGQPFPYNQAINKPGTFPQNLLLPRGQTYGQEFFFTVAVNSYQGNPQPQDQQPQDNRAQGFPFDRTVSEDSFEQVKNIFFQSVKVYRKKPQEINSVEY